MAKTSGYKDLALRSKRHSRAACKRDRDGPQNKGKGAISPWVRRVEANVLTDKHVASFQAPVHIARSVVLEYRNRVQEDAYGIQRFVA